MEFEKALLCLVFAILVTFNLLHEITIAITLHVDYQLFSHLGNNTKPLHNI